MGQVNTGGLRGYDIVGGNKHSQLHSLIGQSTPGTHIAKWLWLTHSKLDVNPYHYTNDPELRTDSRYPLEFLFDFDVSANTKTLLHHEHIKNFPPLGNTHTSDNIKSRFLDPTYPTYTTDSEMYYRENSLTVENINGLPVGAMTDVHSRRFNVCPFFVSWDGLQYTYNLFNVLAVDPGGSEFGHTDRLIQVFKSDYDFELRDFWEAYVSWWNTQLPSGPPSYTEYYKFRKDWELV